MSRRTPLAALGALTTVGLAAAVVLAPAPAALAATGPTAAPVLYDAAASTGVVRLLLTLPAPVPGLPNPVELTLVGTSGKATRTASGPTSTSAAGLLGGPAVTGGPLAPVLGPLARTVSASLDRPGPTSATSLAVPSNPLGLSLDVGDQTAAVVPATAAGRSGVRLATAGLGSLRSLGLGAALDPALAQLNSALATLASMSAPVTGAIGALPALPSVSVPNPLAGVVPGTPPTLSTPSVGGATVAGAINDLPAQLSALQAKLLDGPAVALTGVQSAQTTTPTATTAAAGGTAGLADVALFGGLVTVTATQASAAAQAGAAAGDAKAAADATLVSVKVSDALGTLLQAVASDRGITAGLLDGALGQTLDKTVKPVVQTVNAALSTVLSQLTALLQMLNSGAQLVQQGSTHTKTSPDGRTASAIANPAQVKVGLPGAMNLLQLSIGSVQAAAAVTPAPVAVTGSTPPAPATASGMLPHTGTGPAGALAALGLLLSAGGVRALRRRPA